MERAVTEVLNRLRIWNHLANSSGAQLSFIRRALAIRVSAPRSEEGRVSRLSGMASLLAAIQDHVQT